MKYPFLLPDLNQKVIACAFVFQNSKSISMNALCDLTKWISFYLFLVCWTCAADAQVSDLIISEYGEGSGNNKYLEIYNGTGNAADLKNYSIWKITNGGNWKEDSIHLSGILEQNQTLILHHPQANLSIRNAGNLQIASEVINFNGNDAIALVKNNQILDVIGDSGIAPDEAWKVAGIANATANHTLRRKTNVCQPSSDWSISQGSDTTNTQWLILPNQDWANLGAHTVDCPLPAPQIIAQDDLDGNTQKLINKNIPNLDGGPGDYFGLGNLSNWPQNAGVPFNLTDDTEANVGGSGQNTEDNKGIFGKNRDKENNFFGISDSDEFDDRQRASWTFDIEGFTNLKLQIDMGGMAAGSGFPNQANAVFEVSINNGIAQKAFILQARESSGNYQYRPLDNDTITPARRVIEVTGDNPISKYQAEDNSLADNTYLNKTPVDDPGAGQMDTYSTPINGSGTRLTITLIADFPFEAMAFDNIRILGTPGEDDFRPFVNIGLSDPNTSEALSNPGTFNISRTGNLDEALTVFYTKGGSTSDNDYTPTLTGKINIPAGQANTSIQITPINDTLKEGSEILILTISENSRYRIGTQSAQLIISDDDTDAELIHTIQGVGAISPFIGDTVAIEGIVTGDFQNNDDNKPGQFDPDQGDLNGFFVQEERADWDNDDLSSEGIFVFEGNGNPNIDVKPGQLVRVRGRVSEYSSGGTSFTQLVGISEIQVLGQGEVPSPVDVNLPFESEDFLERYEGMLVRFPQNLIISEYFNFDRLGEIVLSKPLEGLPTDRHFSPTTYLSTNTAIDAELKRIALNRITLDDGRPSATSGNSPQNPDPTRHPNGQVFNLENRFRGGDQLSNTIGVLEQTFGKYRIHPTQGADYKAVNLREDKPADVGGNIKVASFNVLNYFTTFGERGADDQVEFDRQKTKILSALQVINADVVGLIEIENNNDQALKDLIQGLNQGINQPENQYKPILTNKIGDDAITVALIYKGKNLKPLGEFALLDDPSFTDPQNTGRQKNRIALAQSFEEISTGEVFTVVVNHLKSKGSGCGEGDDDSRQGNCNETRRGAAEALIKWLSADPTDSNDPDVLILGDLNAYDQEDPIRALTLGVDQIFTSNDDYTDLLKERLGEFAYSYNFDGKLGYLDYALANQSLLPQVTGVTAWHINADEPDILDYDMSFRKDAQDALYEPNPFRSSDHDPVIVGLDLSHATIDFVLSTDPSSCEIQNGTMTIYASPSEGVEYSIDGGIHFQESSRFTGLRPGNCRVVVRKKSKPEFYDKFGSVIRLNSSGSPVIQTIIPKEPSNPGKSDGQITILIKETKEAFEYSLDGSNFQESAIFSNLPAGSYQILIRKKNNPSCSSSANVILREKQVSLSER